MKENECISELKQTIIKILESTGLLKTCNLDDQWEYGTREQIRPDFAVNVKTKDNLEYSLVFEVKSLGQPRYTRMAINQLQSIISSKKNAYGVFGSAYMSAESMKICRENDIGYLDVAGNCYLKFNKIYIDIQGRPNPSPSTRPIKSLFAKKTTRAIRIILTNPEKIWTVKDLARESKLSLGLTSNIKKKLLEFEFIKEKNGKFSISNSESLLNKWAENYNYKKNGITNYYSPDETKKIEKKLSEYCKKNKIIYALTLTSGASRVAPYLRYSRVFAYNVDSTESIAQGLDLKEVTSGPNITLLKPYDESILWGIQDINGINVVSDVQLYLDLLSYKGRGEEAAKYLFENRLKRIW